MSKVTVIEAAFLTGKHRQTINKFTKDGRLSHSLNEEGAKVIEVSELTRVFPLVKTMDDLAAAELGGEEESSEKAPAGLAEQLAIATVKLESAINECNMLKAERERERRQLQERVDYLEGAYAKSQEQQTLLITDQSKAGLQRRTDQDAEIRQIRQQMARMRQAIEEQKQVPWFLRWLSPGGKGASKEQSPPRAAQQTSQAG